MLAVGYDPDDPPDFDPEIEEPEDSSPERVVYEQLGRQVWAWQGDPDPVRRTANFLGFAFYRTAADEAAREGRAPWGEPEAWESRLERAARAALDAFYGPEEIDPEAEQRPSTSRPRAGSGTP